MKYFLNLLFVIYLILPFNYGYEQIDGSFTKKLTKGKINHYSELYQNGSREFAYKYFDKTYRLIVDVPENVDDLEGTHVCSDIMLTIFLRDDAKNIWQCDFPGHFENPIKMACQKLGKSNSTICTDRHQRNPPIFMKTANPDDSQNEASITWTVILICCVIGLIGIIIFAILFIWRNYKKSKIIKNSSKSSTIKKSKHGKKVKQESSPAKSETIEMKNLPPHNDEDKRSPTTIKAGTEDEEEEKKRKQAPKSIPSVTIPSSVNIPSSDVTDPESSLVILKPPNIKLSIPNESSESSHLTVKFQKRTPKKPDSKSINFEEDSTPLLDAISQGVNDAESEIPEECLLKITKYYQQEENNDEPIENEYENIASSTSSNNSAYANCNQGFNIAPDISFNNTATHIVTIGPKTVSILDRKTKESYDFPAAIDYSKTPPKIGIDYSSPTVITSNIYFDETVNDFAKEEHHEMNGIFQYFAIMIDNEKKLINKQKIIVDLLREVITNIIDSKAIILTIPSHFDTHQESLFLEATKIAGFKDVQPLDENLALAYGIKNYYGIEESFIVVKKCHSKIVIFVFDKILTYLKIIENEILEFNTAVNFEADVDESEPKCTTKTNYDISVTEIIDRFLGSQNEPSIAKYLCLVKTDNSLNNILVDKYSKKMKLIVVEDYEKLIIGGTKFLCC